MAETAQASTDRTLYVEREETFAYNQLLHWVHNQPWALLEKRAKKGVSYDEFVRRAGEATASRSSSGTSTSA